VPVTPTASSRRCSETAYNDPRIGKDPQPDHMSKFVVLPDNRRGDWGGVHVNSGIPNRAFHLACVRLGARYSWERAGKIWYGALRALTRTSTFADAAITTVTIAGQMFGNEVSAAVRSAWQDVGVTPGSTIVPVLVG
jgi:Zn-dependent metalloprotease